MPNFTLSVTGKKPISGVIDFSTTLKKFRVKRDQYTIHWNYQVRESAPAPAVFRTGVINNPGSFVRSNFTKEWQLFAADLLALRTFNKRFSELTGSALDYIKQKFTSLYASNRAFNNNAGVDIRANYVTRQRLSYSLPKIDPLICSDDTVLGTKEDYNGITMVKLYSFDARLPPPVPPNLSDPRVLRATIINENGTISNFPQLREYGLAVPYIYISSHPVYFPLYDLIEL